MWNNFQERALEEVVLLVQCFTLIDEQFSSGEMTIFPHSRYFLSYSSVNPPDLVRQDARELAWYCRVNMMSL